MSPPPGMNRTEQKAWRWLVDEKGYDPSEIRRRNAQQTPDFICPDEKYEAKRLYPPRKIQVGGRQEAILDREDPLIVVMGEGDEEPVGVFRWSERSEARFAVSTASGKSATVYLEDRHIDFVERRAINLSKWVRQRLDEEMSREEKEITFE